MNVLVLILLLDSLPLLQVLKKKYEKLKRSSLNHVSCLFSFVLTHGCQISMEKYYVSRNPRCLSVVQLFAITLHLPK